MKDLDEKIKFVTTGYNKIEGKEVFGKSVDNIDPIENKQFATSYWLLDGNAFDNMPAEKWVKFDYVFLSGIPIAMTIPNKYANEELKQKIKAENLKDVPIGFVDLHPINGNKFVASGVGIAKPYQKNGLSKILLYGALKITDAEELLVPTQLSNEFAHYMWLHVNDMELLSFDVLHSQEDTMLYNIKVPSPLEKILEPKDKEELKQKYSEIKNTKAKLFYKSIYKHPCMAH